MYNFTVSLNKQLTPKKALFILTNNSFTYAVGWAPILLDRKSMGYVKIGLQRVNGREDDKQNLFESSKPVGLNLIRKIISNLAFSNTKKKLKYYNKKNNDVFDAHTNLPFGSRSGVPTTLEGNIKPKASAGVLFKTKHHLPQQPGSRSIPGQGARSANPRMGVINGGLAPSESSPTTHKGEYIAESFVDHASYPEKGMRYSEESKVPFGAGLGHSRMLTHQDANPPLRGASSNVLFSRGVQTTFQKKTTFFLNKIYNTNNLKNCFSPPKGLYLQGAMHPFTPTTTAPFLFDALRTRGGVDERGRNVPRYPDLMNPLTSQTRGNKTNQSVSLYLFDKKQKPNGGIRYVPSYSKITEINLITISLASANRIRQWAEKTLPNGKVVGEVINPETVHYKTLKPIKGGLFCERIFGPLKDHECACGKKFNIKNYLTQTSSNMLTKKAPELTTRLEHEQKRYFCRVCDVEYTYSIIRRTQLGYIQLASPTTHVWFVKGMPGYISILLDMKKKHLQNITYNSETLTLEHSLRGRQYLPSTPKSIFESWQKIMKKQYPEKYAQKTLPTVDEGAVLNKTPSTFEIKGGSRGVLAEQLLQRQGGSQQVSTKIPRTGSLLSKKGRVLPQGVLRKQNNLQSKTKKRKKMLILPFYKENLLAETNQSFLIKDRALLRDAPLEDLPDGGLDAQGVRRVFNRALLCSLPPTVDLSGETNEGASNPITNPGAALPGIGGLLGWHSKLEPKGPLLHPPTSTLVRSKSTRASTLASTEVESSASPLGDVDVSKGGLEQNIQGIDTEKLKQFFKTNQIRRAKTFTKLKFHTIPSVHFLPSMQLEASYRLNTTWLRPEGSKQTQSGVEKTSRGIPRLIKKNKKGWYKLALKVNTIPFRFASTSPKGDVLCTKAQLGGSGFQGGAYPPKGGSKNIPTQGFNVQTATSGIGLPRASKRGGRMSLLPRQKAGRDRLLHKGSSFSFNEGSNLLNGGNSKKPLEGTLSLLRRLTKVFLKNKKLSIPLYLLCIKTSKVLFNANLGARLFSIGGDIVPSFLPFWGDKKILVCNTSTRASTLVETPSGYIPPSTFGGSSGCSASSFGDVDAKNSFFGGNQLPHKRYGLTKQLLLNVKTLKKINSFSLYPFHSSLSQKILTNSIIKTWNIYIKTNKNKNLIFLYFFNNLSTRKCVVTPKGLFNITFRLLVDENWVKTKELLTLFSFYPKLKNLNPLASIYGESIHFPVEGAFLNKIPSIAGGRKWKTEKYITKLALMLLVNLTNYHQNSTSVLELNLSQPPLIHKGRFRSNKDKGKQKTSLIQRFYYSYLSNHLRKQMKTLSTVLIYSSNFHNHNLRVVTYNTNSWNLLPLQSLKTQKNQWIFKQINYLLPYVTLFDKTKTAKIAPKLLLGTLKNLYSLRNLKKLIRYFLYLTQTKKRLVLKLYHCLIHELHTIKNNSFNCLLVLKTLDSYIISKRGNKINFNRHFLSTGRCSLQKLNIVEEYQKDSPTNSIQKISLPCIDRLLGCYITPGVITKKHVRNIIINNIYCFSHRELWEHDKDWQDFAYYYYSPTNITDVRIPIYKHRNYDLLFSIDNTLAYTPAFTSPKGDALRAKVKTPTGYLPPSTKGGSSGCSASNKNGDVSQDMQPELYSLGMNINTAFSGAGLIQKLLNEFNYNELKKMDKQNRILLFEYNKYLKKLKKMINSGIIKSKFDYYKACHVRDVLIRRTKLTRKIFNKIVNLTLAPPQKVDDKSHVGHPPPYPSKTKGPSRTGPLPGKGGYNPLKGTHDVPGWTSAKTQQVETNGLNMILTLLPVLPPVLRPVLKMAGQFTISDLNRLYQRIIYRNERLKKFLKDPALSSSFEMKYAQRLLQESVDNLIQNGKTGVVPEKDARGRLLKSLSDILKGKQGRFRQYLLGKRVDYSGRSVIVVGPRLKLHECGIPKEMALILYSPFLIKRILNEKIADTYLSAKKLIQTNPLLISQLLREIMKECPVLLNRAPTLHRLGFQAFQPKLVDGKAILLHPLVCPAFNADFDGDQMAVHVPITFEARAEAWKLMLARNNLTSPATGEPIILPSQDMVLGCYYLTTNCAPNNRPSVTTQASNTLFNKISGRAQSNRAKFSTHQTKGNYKRGSGMFFHNINDVFRAYNQQLIHIHAVIWVDINAQIENGNIVEQPLEIRIPIKKYTKTRALRSSKDDGATHPQSGGVADLSNKHSHLVGAIGHKTPHKGGLESERKQNLNYIEIFSKSHNVVNSKGIRINQIIQTTPGKILFNLIIKNAIEKHPRMLTKYNTKKGLVKTNLINTIDVLTDNYFKRSSS